jgi:hypothetical protein
MAQWMQITIAAILAVLLLWVEHWGPWAVLVRARRVSPWVNYIQGTLAIQLPLTGLLVLWQDWLPLIALWVISVLGGLAVMASYWIDHVIEIKTRLLIAESQSASLRPQVDDDPGTHQD